MSLADAIAYVAAIAAGLSAWFAAVQASAAKADAETAAAALQEVREQTRLMTRQDAREVERDEAATLRRADDARAANLQALDAVVTALHNGIPSRGWIPEKESIPFLDSAIQESRRQAIKLDDPWRTQTLELLRTIGNPAYLVKASYKPMHETTFPGLQTVRESIGSTAQSV